ncbi:MAG: hypothetical protein IKA09_01060 [Lachnospiraceae bacterium]|nr:hypothetical protein [Lachnospiraceae bacterium]
MTELNTQQFGLCDIQGRLFELALRKGYNCKAFIEKFMNSKTAAALDESYDRLQWAGEEYILEELNEEVGGIPIAGISYHNEIMYWSGYVYRYWHYYTGEYSKEIYAIADAEKMATVYLGFHTLDVEMAIDRLKEIK